MHQVHANRKFCISDGSVGIKQLIQVAFICRRLQARYVQICLFSFGRLWSGISYLQEGEGHSLDDKIDDYVGSDIRLYTIMMIMIITIILMVIINNYD